MGGRQEDRDERYPAGRESVRHHEQRQAKCCDEQAPADGDSADIPLRRFNRTATRDDTFATRFPRKCISTCREANWTWV